MERNSEVDPNFQIGAKFLPRSLNWNGIPERNVFGARSLTTLTQSIESSENFITIINFLPKQIRKPIC